MKSRKILVALLGALMSVCMVFGLVACSPAHDTHSFSADFKTSTTQHWKECSCGEKSELADHDFGSGVLVGENAEYTCSVCSYKKTVPATTYSNKEVLTNFFNSFALANGEGINVFVETEEITLSGMNVTYYSTGNDEDIDSLCDITFDLGVELFAGLNEEGEITANGAFALIGNATTVADGDEFTNAEIYVYFVLDGTTLYTYLEQSEVYPGLPEEDREYNDYEEVNAFVLDLMEVFNAQEGPASFIQSLPALLEEILPTLESFYDENLKDAVEKIFDDYADDVADFIFKAAEYNFAIEKNADEIIFSFDTDKLLAQSKDLAEKTLVEIYEMHFGEGAFDALKETLFSALDLTIDDILMAIFTEDFTIEEVESLINTLIAIVYPEEPAPTLTDLLGADIVEILEDEEFRALELFTILTQDAEEPIDKEELKAQITSYLDQFANMTYYDILAYGYDFEEEQLATIKEMVDKVITIAGDIISLELTLNADGSFEALEGGIALDNDTFAEIWDLLPKHSAGSPYSTPTKPEVEIPFESITAEVNAQVTIGAFQNIMGVDFEEVKELAIANAD